MNGPPDYLLLAFVFLVEVGEFFFQRFDLGAVADHDVRVVGIVQRVVLVVVLSVVEAFVWHDLRDDGVGKCLRGVELRDVRGGNAALLVILGEDGGAVAGATIRALAVERAAWFRW